MSGQKAIAIRRSEFVRRVIAFAPPLSRARELVQSGLLDRAAQIAELAHSLTDSAMAAMETEIAEQGLDVAMSGIRSLRSAVFIGITSNIIDRLEHRHGGETR